MPFFLGTPTVDGDQLIFNWDESYSFDKSDITYQFRLSSEWEFGNIIYEETAKNLNMIRVDMLEPGTYFWQVTAMNQAGKIQVPFDSYTDADSNNHYGMKYLYITNDGQVIEK
jgi:spore coat protein H